MSETEDGSSTAIYFLLSKYTKGPPRNQRARTVDSLQIYTQDKSVVQSVPAMLYIVLLKDSDSFQKIKAIILLPKSCLSKSQSQKIHFFI